MKSTLVGFLAFLTAGVASAAPVPDLVSLAECTWGGHADWTVSVSMPMEHGVAQPPYAVMAQGDQAVYSSEVKASTPDGGALGGGNFTTIYRGPQGFELRITSAPGGRVLSATLSVENESVYLVSAPLSCKDLESGQAG